MSTDYSAEELQATALLDGLNAVVDGQDMAIGLIAIQALMRDVAIQAEPEIRVLVVRNLRELADELEAIDAPKH